MVNWLLILFLFVILQRVIELAVARQNARVLRSRGAIEYGKGHYKLFVLLHTGFLCSLYLESLARGFAARPSLTPNTILLVLAFITAQGARVWCIASLGRFWNTRILVLPGTKVVQKGPYKWIRHPNYFIVCSEIALLSLLFHAYWTGLVFFSLNLWLISYRIRVEEQALRTQTDYAEVMSDRWWVVPGRRSN